ncbi:Precorrin-6A reductase [Roseovarius gaetbuli]|uniref:Precorrin-6A reductase n=1 Tax=Roseovarius gaetbuli TaxID=1356575 RepID=A0A1X6ZLW0_9RHOB|nr:cobalt-precorrin-6A reductase [Roseovarius gaetbuli]SLN55514.1 Precorrin-6A reductase [Roseovarius gaetbuli]
MTILLLAGTGEAQTLARALSEQGHAVVASLAGATRAPRALGVPMRIGGFGGEEGFQRYLQEAGIRAVLDATHPFAAHISNRSAAVCAAQGIPYCQLLRPEWTAGPGDNWVFIDREEDAAAHIPEGARVFLATGRQTLERFANLAGCYLICRQIDPPEAAFPFENGEYLIGRPPFSEEHERELFKRLAIDWLVVKNAGGSAPMSKLVAARDLGLRVVVINRPAQPDAPRVQTVEAALAWVNAL